MDYYERINFGGITFRTESFIEIKLKEHYYIDKAQFVAKLVDEKVNAISPLTQINSVSSLFLTFWNGLSLEEKNFLKGSTS